ncbi:MAG: T9SS type A sorting domain-containing protein [Candidatus Latescibacteria bacterium]|nr:T9SS type A sorting domain-containing protein [Candidatus Latescibacterota bacterium]
MNTPHASCFILHVLRFTFHVLCFLCAALVIGITDEAHADLPDLGFGILDLSSASEGRGEIVDGAQVTEGFGKGLSHLVAGDYDTIRVALTNFGASEAEQAVVRFYEEGAPEKDRAPIGEDVTVTRIAPGETVILQKVWDTLGRSGLNRISIQIDPDESIEEGDEKNNRLSFERTVFLMGDFNQDGRIDPLDRTILEGALGSREGDANWNPVCDISKAGQSIPDPPNIRPQPDGMADHADHVVFDRLMDLNLKSALAGIAFDHSDHVVFKVGDEIPITVHFPTVGTAEVGKLSVQFYDGPPDAGGVFIGESLVSSAYGGLGKADIIWRTDGIDVGTHQIVAVADPDNQKVESSEANNVLSTTIELASTDVTDPDLPLPRRFLLMQNMPNPFNAGTVIPFEITQSDNAETRIAIYDNLGREVYIQQVYVTQGRGHIVWNGRDHRGRSVSSGVYFYRLIINGEIIGVTRRMVLLR